MPDLRDRSAEMLHDIFDTLATCLGLPADVFDGEWVNDLAAEMADEWVMWLAAGAVMPDWTYPIEAES
jgi:hypothetical protein